MTETFLLDDPQTVARLDSVACILEWTRSMPSPERARFLNALIDGSSEVQQVVFSQLAILKGPESTPVEREQALTTIAAALFPNPGEENGQRLQNLAIPESGVAGRTSPLAGEAQTPEPLQQTFARRLRELMDAKQITQQELADRVGCSQPAISQMLRRLCRPQKQTILNLAAALNVHPTELWPDMDVADMLDAVASFQQDDYTMTDAEAIALADAANRNRPKIPVKLLPARP